MTGLRTRTIVLAAVGAGLVAGLVFGLFHFLLSEPLIERAIALEAAHHAAEGLAPEPEVVTREMQRVGLLIGSVLYGAFLGLLLGAGCALVRPQLPRVGPGLNGLLAALIVGWLIGLLPLLKYPANPPGVGDPETIGSRQALFLLFWVLSFGGLVVASGVYQLLRARGGRAALTGAVGAYAVYAAVLLLVMPPPPDPVTLPADIVVPFRVASLAGQGVLWGVLGVVFGLLLARGSRAAGPARAGGGPLASPPLPSRYG
ncbi:MAG TPA: CbtA family protein [Chloroflexota bacterium]|nr:CbtA family protein [Chloroflexota bacterium]